MLKKITVFFSFLVIAVFSCAGFDSLAAQERLPQEVLEKKLEKAQKLAVILNNKVESLNAELATLRKQKNVKNIEPDKLKEAAAAVLRRAHEEINLLKQENTSLAKELENLQGKKVPAAEASSQELKKALVEIKLLREENNSLTKKMEAMRGKANMAKETSRQIEAGQARQKEAESLARKTEAKLARAQAEIDSLKKDNIVLAKELGALRKRKNDAQNDPGQEAKQLKAEVTFLKKENDALTKELTGLNKTKSGIKNVSGELSKAQEQIDLLKKENAVLAKALAGYRKKGEDKALGDSLDKGLENKVKLAQADADMYREENIILAKKLEEARSVKATPDGEIALLKKENTSLLKEVENLRQKKEGETDLTQRLGRLKEKVDSFKQDETGLAKEAENLRKKNATLQTQARELKDKISLLEKNIELSSLAQLTIGSLRRLDTEAPSEGETQEQLDRQLYLNTGYLYAQKGKYGEAIQQYLAALKYGSDNKDIYYNLGFLYAQEGKFKQAIGAYKNSLKGTQEDKDVYYNLAIIHAKNLNDRQTAMEYYKKTLSSAFTPLEKAAD